MLKRVVAYCRVSTDSAGQIEMATGKIKSNPEWEFAGVYADPAYTGTNDERPEFQRMMADARKHKLDIILVKSISRNVITGEPDKEQYGQYVSNHHEPIVDEKIWNLAQELFKANSANKGERDEEILAMLQEGLKCPEIAEY